MGTGRLVAQKQVAPHEVTETPGYSLTARGFLIPLAGFGTFFRSSSDGDVPLPRG